MQDTNGMNSVGLDNIGNTCFLNTCIQILFHTPELNQILMERHKPCEENPDSVITAEWIRLVQEMSKHTSSRVIISPKRFVFFIQKVAKKKGQDLFTGWSQNDFTEFLYFLVDCFHSNLSRKVKLEILGEPSTKIDDLAIQCYSYLREAYRREYSEMMQLFYGVFVSQICSLDESVCYSSKPENYFVIDLEIPASQPNRLVSLDDCIQLFTQGEKMTGEDAWFNEKTGKKEDIVKKMSFWNFPKVLTVSLKRFNNELTKKDVLIDFPLAGLDLSKYTCGYNRQKFIYDLYAVCNHSGDNQSGHYTAFIQREGKWYCYNDTQVFEIQENQIVSPYAYCLFYLRRNG